MHKDPSATRPPAARSGQPISFWQFTKYGIVTTIATTLVAWAYVSLRYFVLACGRNGLDARNG